MSNSKAVTGDVSVEKVDNTHQIIHVQIETGTVDIRVKDGNNIWAEEAEPSITHNNMKLWTNEQGIIHRISGPAVIDKTKDLEKFFIEGQGLTKEEFYKDPRVMTLKKKEIDLEFDPGEDSKA